MPNRDGTGPMGQGPRSGRNGGNCGTGRSNKSGIPVSYTHLSLGYNMLAQYAKV